MANQSPPNIEKWFGVWYNINMGYKRNDNSARAARLRHYYKNKKQYIDRATNRRKEIYKLIVKKKSSGCIHCPEKEICVLDLHHLKDKKITPSALQNCGWSNKRVKEELDKCVVLCANCHRKVTFGIIKLGKVPGADGTPNPIV